MILRFIFLFPPKTHQEYLKPKKTTSSFGNTQKRRKKPSLHFFKKRERKERKFFYLSNWENFNFVSKKYKADI